MNPSSASCTPRSSWKDKHPNQVVCGGSSNLAYPIFNFRGEYDRFDEYGEQVGGEAISDTGVICMEVRMRQDGRSKVDSRRTMDDG